MLLNRQIKSREYSQLKSGKISVFVIVALVTALTTALMVGYQSWPITGILLLFTVLFSRGIYMAAWKRPQDKYDAIGQTLLAIESNSVAVGSQLTASFQASGAFQGPIRVSMQCLRGYNHGSSPRRYDYERLWCDKTRGSVSQSFSLVGQQSKVRFEFALPDNQPETSGGDGKDNAIRWRITANALLLPSGANKPCRLKRSWDIPVIR